MNILRSFSGKSRPLMRRVLRGNAPLPDRCGSVKFLMTAGKSL
jgi:hypothetical protein